MAPSAEDQEDAKKEAAKAKDEGNAHFKAGEYQAAVDAYSRSLGLDPSQHLCFSNRSAAYLKLGSQAETALEDARKCVELAPTWAKGYSRQAAALQSLKRWDEAEECCSKGVSTATDDVSALRKMLSEVKSRRFQEALTGTWHGTVSEVLGGYDQEMEFLDERSVRVEVLGRSIVGKYWVDGGHEPHHLSIQVPMADMPPNMPPPPPVPYIARIDAGGLHLCCPFMKEERPTEFEGPGYCLMKSGPLAKTGDAAEVLSCSHGEKLLKCARELLDALPDRKLEEVTVYDQEEQAREKVMAQVRLESSMFAVQKRFGEDIMKEVFNATRASGAEMPEALLGSKEIRDLSRKLKICGILDEDGAGADAAQSPPPGPAKAPERPTASAPAPEPKAPASSPEPSGSGSGAVTAAIAVGAVAVAVAAFFAWRRSRK